MYVMNRGGRRVYRTTVYERRSESDRRNEMVVLRRGVGEIENERWSEESETGRRNSNEKRSERARSVVCVIHRDKYARAFIRFTRGGETIYLTTLALVAKPCAGNRCA